MSLLPRLCLLIALSGLSSGCQTNPTASGAGDVTPNAVTGDTIEVTALDAPPAASSAPPASVAAAGLATPPADAAAPLPGPAQGAPLPAPDSAVTGEADAPSAPEATAAEVAPPPPPKSELQIACERKRGKWADTGGGLKVCIRPTRDGGKRCTRESQCQGLCLARSGTCSPVEPLLGCNEILQDNGTRATQCIE